MELDTISSRISFSFWRKEIALAAELIQDKTILYSDEDKIDWKYLEKQTDFLGYWKEHPGDPIWYLIAHSDTSGIITWQQAKELAPRLKELVPKLPGTGKFPNYQFITKKTITLFNKAVKNEEDIIFS